jgi:hypothetical protein
VGWQYQLSRSLPDALAMTLSERESRYNSAKRQCIDDEPIPGFGPLTDEDKLRGWVSGEALVAFAAQCKLQRENDGSKRRRK